MKRAQNTYKIQEAKRSNKLVDDGMAVERDSGYALNIDNQLDDLWILFQEAAATREFGAFQPRADADKAAFNEMVRSVLTGRNFDGSFPEN